MRYNIRTKDCRPAIDFLKKEQMLGHALTSIHSLELNYNRTPTEERIKLLLDEYLKALPELTISDEECIKVEVKKLQIALYQILAFLLGKKNRFS
jgi:hypothetical protein